MAEAVVVAQSQVRNHTRTLSITSHIRGREFRSRRQCLDA